MNRRISEVKIKDLDESFATKGARILSVKVGSHSFLTPTRPFSSTEISAKSFLGYRGELKSDVSSIQIDFSGKRKEQFLKNNGVLHKAEQTLQSHAFAAYDFATIPVLQMDPCDGADVVPFKIAFDMQKSIDGLGAMCIPEMGPRIDIFSKTINNWSESAEEFDKGAVAQISLSEDVITFAKKLDVLCELSESGSIQAVNIRYVHPAKCRQQLAELWSRRDKLKAVVNCTSVRDNINTTGINGISKDLELELLQYGFDIITPKKNTANAKFIVKRNMEPPAKTLDEIDSFKFAVHNASVTIKNNLWFKLEHPPECRCSICRNDYREKIIERFSYKDNGDIEKSGMRYFSILHDHQSDMQELNIMRDYVKTDESKEYDCRLKDGFNNLLNSNKNSIREI